MPSLRAKMKTFLILAKHSWKIEIEFFPEGAISHENLTLPQIFYEWL